MTRDGLRTLLSVLLGAAAWLLAGLVMAAPLVPLDGRWQAADAQQAQAFDPQRGLTLPRADDGHTVQLWPRNGQWPAGPWVLEVRQAALQHVTLEWPPGQPQTRAQTIQVPGQWPGHGRLGFHVVSPPPDGAPLTLRVQAHGSMPGTLLWTVVSESDYLQRDARWLAIASACLATMLAMAVMAAFFAWRLRDATFAFYALYVVAFALVMALQTGYTVHPLGQQWLGEATRFWGRLATATAIVSAILFLDRFADLPRLLPRGRRWLRGYAAVVALCAVPALVPLPALEALGRTLINPLLALGAPLLLGAAALAAHRGSRLAGVFLIGWTPLLLVTALSSLGLDGRIGIAWDDGLAALATGAFEALVLALGLAERSAGLRGERDLALRQAHTDALTGLLNRRSWDARLPVLLAAAPAHLSVMFLDLDHFKRINDALGHSTGDRCLREVARVLRLELDPAWPVARYGGEEFVVALPGTDAATALQIAERIRTRFRTALADFDALRPTVSIGVAAHQAGEDADTLLRRADHALYQAKQAGRDRVQLAR
ncbi:diguanylate cyclase [Luteimonas sp. TWI662]|uniref:GGDEF domain-containing protein n=1 Tax=Luteimonas sp. TWI662 TaxID=3136789 RepID=UPI0032097F0D